MRQDATQRQVLEGMSGTAFGALAAPTRLASTRCCSSATSRFSASTPSTTSPRSTRATTICRPTTRRRRTPRSSRPRAGDDRVPSCSTSTRSRRASPCPRKNCASTTRRTRSATRRPEERCASHILVKAEKTPGREREGQGEGRAPAGRTAQTPASFADLARRTATTLALAQRGGDLDFLAAARWSSLRGRRVRAQAGRDQRRGRERLRLPHHPGHRHPAAARRASSRCAPRSRTGEEAAGAERLPEVAVDFTNMVYEQADSPPAAEKFARDAHGRHVTRMRRCLRRWRWPTPHLLEALFGADATAEQAQHRGRRVGPNQPGLRPVVSTAGATSAPSPRSRRWCVRRWR